MKLITYVSIMMCLLIVGCSAPVTSEATIVPIMPTQKAEDETSATVTPSITPISSATKNQL
jgi:hypothetical protein